MIFKTPSVKPAQCTFALKPATPLTPSELGLIPEPPAPESAIVNVIVGFAEVVLVLAVGVETVIVGAVVSCPENFLRFALVICNWFVKLTF